MPQPHILVVDDDPIFRELASAYLADVGFKVSAVGDGDQALSAVAEWRFDLITDMVMPNIDGLELIRSLRAQAPGTPIIGVSGGLSASNPGLVLRAATAQGAAEVLAKPINRERLLQAVAAVLEQRLGN